MSHAHKLFWNTYSIITCNTRIIYNANMINAIENSEKLSPFSSIINPTKGSNTTCIIFDIKLLIEKIVALSSISSLFIYSLIIAGYIPITILGIIITINKCLYDRLIINGVNINIPKSNIKILYTLNFLKQYKNLLLTDETMYNKK